MAKEFKHSVTGPHPDFEIHAVMPDEAVLNKDSQTALPSLQEALKDKWTVVEHVTDHLCAAVKRLVGQGNLEEEKPRFARGYRGEVVLPGGELSPAELTQRDTALAVLRRLPWRGPIRDLAQAIRIRTLMEMNSMEGQGIEVILAQLALRTREQLEDNKYFHHGGGFDTYYEKDRERRVILSVEQLRPELMVKRAVSVCPNEMHWYDSSRTVARWTGGVEGLQVSPAEQARVRIQGRLQWEVVAHEEWNPGIY